jgi:hypothetical protein
MNAKQFEIFVNQLLTLYGYQSINPTNRVEGRGTTHQIDAIGINKLTPTFSYPITIIAEAKYFSRQRIVGIPILRNFYGMISDVRQKLPNNFLYPSLADNVYNNGTSNIIGIVISTTGFSSFARNFAYSHGIFLVTINFIRNNQSLYFANLGGETVIIQVPTLVNLDQIYSYIRRGINLEAIISNTFLEKDFLTRKILGQLKLIRKINYFDTDKHHFSNEQSPGIVSCFLYEISIAEVGFTIRTISQNEITADTLLTIELPQSKNYFTIEIENIEDSLPY